MTQRYQTTQNVIHPHARDCNSRCGTCYSGLSLLELDDQADLSELRCPYESLVPSNGEIEAYSKAGGNLLLVRDIADREKNALGTIVALATYVVVPTLNLKTVLLTDTFYRPGHNETALAQCVAQALRSLHELSHEPYHLVSRGKTISSRHNSFSVLDLAERMDDVSDTQLSIPGTQE